MESTQNFGVVPGFHLIVQICGGTVAFNGDTLNTAHFNRRVDVMNSGNSATHGISNLFERTFHHLKRILLTIAGGAVITITLHFMFWLKVNRWIGHLLCRCLFNSKERFILVGWPIWVELLKKAFAASINKLKSIIWKIFT